MDRKVPGRGLMIRVMISFFLVIAFFAVPCYGRDDPAGYSTPVVTDDRDGPDGGVLGGEPQIEYETIKKGKTKLEIGAIPKYTGDGVEVDVVAFATGKGADFRRWEVTDIKMDIGGDKRRPYQSDYFYAKKDSAFTKPATVVFAVIGSQVGKDEPHHGYSKKGSGGGPSGGSSGLKAPEQHRGKTAKAVDRAGMSAGLGLLVSQSGGDITGRKSTFKLDKDDVEKIDPERDTFNIVVEHSNTHKKIRMKAKMNQTFQMIKQMIRQQHQAKMSIMDNLI